MLKILYVFENIHYGGSEKLKWNLWTLFYSIYDELWYSVTLQSPDWQLYWWILYWNSRTL